MSWWQMSLVMLPVFIATIVLLGALDLVILRWQRNKLLRGDLTQFPDGWESDQKPRRSTIYVDRNITPHPGPAPHEPGHTKMGG